MKCINCESENTIAHTNKKLRVLHLLIWQCLDCNKEWQTGQDIDMPIRPDLSEQCAEYENELEAYLAKCEVEDELS